MHDDIYDLYQELILDHNAHPHHFGKLECASHQARGNNPLCGDEMELFVKIEDGTIKEIGFTGEGCAIFKSSASIMTDEVIGKSLAEVQHVFKAFHELLTSADEFQGDLNLLGKASVFSGVKQFPARVKCATLPWHTLVASFDSNKDFVTTE